MLRKSDVRRCRRVFLIGSIALQWSKICKRCRCRFTQRGQQSKLVTASRNNHDHCNNNHAHNNHDSYNDNNHDDYHYNYNYNYDNDNYNYTDNHDDHVGS